VKHSLTIIGIILLLGLLVWFGLLANGRAKTVGNGTGNAGIYVLITASMSFVGELVMSALVVVWLLKRKAALLKQRIKDERAKVDRSRGQIVHIEETIFGYREGAAKKRAAHTISHDHAGAEAPPCSK
jgi:hypothetical protein